MKMRVYLGLCLTLLLAVGLTALLERLAGQAPVKTAAPVLAAEEDTVIPPRSSAPSPSPSPAPSEEPRRQEEFVGLWVPFFTLAAGGQTEAGFRENYLRIADAAVEKGVTALFVHVRFYGDSLYPSTLYPWSHILTGGQGKAPGWDPLDFMVRETHARGMEFHAWINPMRLQSGTSPIALSPDGLYESWKGENPYYFMEWENGIYLDPAWPQVRAWIAQGAAEIAERYPVDGVHFDDYFYPSEDENLDWQAYELYAQGVDTPLSLAQWRASNITALLQEVHRAVHRARAEAVFGVSPSGNLSLDWSIGADVPQWCAAPGCVDYICPQLYYSFEQAVLPYGEAFAQWDALPKFEGLRVWAGLALYKAGTDADGGTWLDETILSRQREMARTAGWDGVVLFAAEQLDRWA